MVSQEQAPLAYFRNFRRLLQNFCDRLPVFQLHPHKHPGHEREVEGHVELIPVGKICTQVSRPLVGFRQQHASRKLQVEAGAQFFDDGMGLGKVFAIGPFALDQVWNCVQPEGIHSHLQPEAHYVPHLFSDFGTVVIEIRLVTEKTVPVVLLRNRVPGPIGKLGVQKYDSRSLIFCVCVTPHIPVTPGILARAAGFLEPRVLVRSVIQHHLNDDPDSALVGGVEEQLKIVERAVSGMNRPVVGNVVAIIAQG